MGLLSRLFRTNVSETPDEDTRECRNPAESEDEEKQRPFPLETEEVTSEQEVVIEGSFERSVEILTFTGNVPTTIVEYDDTSVGSGTTQYYGYTGCQYNRRMKNLKMSFDDVLLEVNNGAIAHRKPVGSYTVECSRPATIVTEFEKILNLGDVPDECTKCGAPKTVYDLMEQSGNYVTRADGGDFTQHAGGYGGPWGFESGERYGYNGLIYGRHTYKSEWTGGLEIEPQGSTPELLADTIETGTDVMRAVFADGRVVIPDDEQALDSEGSPSDSDILRIANLAERQN